MKITKLIVLLFILFSTIHCNNEKNEKKETGTGTIGDDGRFSASVISAKLPGGYFDSIFINKNGDRVYFIHSMYPASVLNGLTPAGSCTASTALPGHTSAPGLEWNTDIYYMEWNGTAWSDPVNAGSKINTLGMECCMWLSDDETEMIFYRATDLDGDGIDGDVGLPQTGNYRATRAGKNDPWGDAVPLNDLYGTANQGNTMYRHDLHKTPSGNYYLWERDAAGSKRLLFGKWNGTGHDSPVLISGSVHEDTQPWVSDDETLLLYNHRSPDGTSDLYKMTRANASGTWETPAIVPISGFEDPAGKRIWGEPTFDATEQFMIFIRFNTIDPQCWISEIMHVPGNHLTGFHNPVKLN